MSTIARRRWGPALPGAGLPVTRLLQESALTRTSLRIARPAIRSFRWIWQAARRPFLLTLLAQVVGAVSLGLVLLSARSLAQQLTGDAAPSSLAPLLPPVTALGGALFVSGVSVVVDREARYVMAELVVHRLQREIADIAGSVDYARYEDQEFHDLLDRAGNEGTQSAIQMVYDLLALVSSALTAVSLVVVLASTVPTMLPLLILVALPFVVAVRRTARMAYELDHELTPSDRLRFSLHEVLTGKREAKEVRVYALHHTLRDRWEELFGDRSRRLVAVATRRALLNGAASLASSALVVGMLLVIVNGALDRSAELGDAAIAVVALQQLAARIRTSSVSAGSLREATLFLEDFERFDALRGDRTEPGDAEPLAPLAELRLEQVSFRYPGTDREVLRRIDLEIGANEIVALVGRSGSGKTTLAHLVAGLYQPSAGRITWNGVDGAGIPRSTWWASLAVVYQDYAMYELSARENITLGDHRRPCEEPAVRQAAARAGVDDVLSGLPGGYDTMLSRSYDGGAALSQGEWQRVAVARALYRDASLVILDEPAASLDAYAERELFERLLGLCASRSALMVSHRFSTVRLAHRIYVLDDGEVTEHGTHSELMAQNGLYAEMFRIQAAGYLESS